MTDYVIGEKVNLCMKKGLERVGEIVDIHKTNNSFIYYVVRTDNGVELACAGSMRKIEKPKDIKAKYEVGNRVRFLGEEDEFEGVIEKILYDYAPENIYYDIRFRNIYKDKDDALNIYRVSENNIIGIVEDKKVEEKAEANGVATTYMKEYVKDILGKKVAEKDNDKLSIRVTITDMDEFKGLLKEASDKIKEQEKVNIDLSHTNDVLTDAVKEILTKYAELDSKIKLQGKMLEISAKYYSELLLNYTGGRNHRRYYEPHQLLTMWEEAAKKELSNEKEK